MTSAALVSLVEQVEAVISNPVAARVSVEDKALDRALADLQAACAKKEELPSQIEGFWV